MGVIDKKEDIIHLTYKKIKKLGTNPESLEVRKIVEESKEKLEKAEERIPAPFIGNTTDWALHQ